MLAIQMIDIGMNKLYNWYQHMFSGLSLKHLKFNYLKMICKVFYLGRLAIEHSIL